MTDVMREMTDTVSGETQIFPGSAKTDSGADARIIGLDLARALAIFGMVFVNYKNAMRAFEGAPEWLIFVLTRFEGRASATFVTLAGMGLILLSQRARDSGNLSARRAARNRVLKRAAFIFVIGVANYQLWPGDILHFYGVYMAAGAYLLFVRRRYLLPMAVGSIVIAVILRLTLDHTVGWGPQNIWYLDFWTVSGFFRNLFFNGVHPFFPWVAYMIVGMWLAQGRYLEAGKWWRFLLVAIVAAISFELLYASIRSDLLTEALASGRRGLPYSAVYSTLRWLAAQCTAVALILFCIGLGQRFARSRIVDALVKTGQLALTHYLGHVYLILGPMFVLDQLDETHTRMFSVYWALAFYAFAVCLSVIWRRDHRKGPFEWVMRKVAG